MIQHAFELFQWYTACGNIESARCKIRIVYEHLWRALLALTTAHIFHAIRSDLAFVQIAPLSRSFSISPSEYPNSAKTSDVCSPRRGGLELIDASVFSNFTAGPIPFHEPD